MTDIEKEIQEYAKRKRRRTRRLGGSAPRGHVTVPEYARLHQVSINQVYTWIHHGTGEKAMDKEQTMRQVTIQGYTFRIYQGKEAGVPEAHEPESWYYEPEDWDTGEEYSDPYASPAEAEAAARQAVDDYPDLFPPKEK